MCKQQSESVNLSDRLAIQSALNHSPLPKSSLLAMQLYQEQRSQAPCSSGDRSGNVYNGSNEVLWSFKVRRKSEHSRSMSVVRQR